MILNNSDEMLLLVGDNPFHKISHLSQERARARTVDPGNPEYAADLIATSVANGANGFTFSVSETTLAILRELNARDAVDGLGLYPVVPYAFEYVRLANQLGGISALTTKLAKDILRCGNLKALGSGFRSVLTMDPESMLKTYLAYEVSRVKSGGGSKARFGSVILHQLITDLALALHMDWLFKVYVDSLLNERITPGFNTGNFAFLVDRFLEWGIDLKKVVILAPFNKVGFQMTPCIEDCERALKDLTEPAVIAMSVLAAGYLSPKDAAGYIAALPNIKGVAIGVSNEKHARETFSLFRECFVKTRR